MQVHFTPEQEAELSQIAAYTGVDAESFVKDATLRLIDETTRFRGAVKEGIAQADAGNVIDDDEVRQWLEQKERS